MFAKAVQKIHPDDIEKGRRGETGIPHSDQWIDRGFPDKESKMWKYNRKNIMKDENGRGVNRGLSEELFQARETRDELLRSVHNSFYADGRYNYQLPASWHNTLNKRIAVRRIETPANDYALTVALTGTAGTTVVNQLFDCFIPSSYSMAEALSAIMVQSKVKGWTKTPATAVVFPELRLHYDNYTVILEIVGAGANFITEIQDASLLKLFNVSEQDQGTILTDTRPVFEFKNVWDRKVLFLHASFVSDTTSGYLGRGGEFYPKPSKMYRYDNNPNFFIETSFDGYFKVPLHWENWILELTLIHDADDYQSP